MSIQVSAIYSAPPESVKRPTASYQPSIWGDHFLKYASHPSQIDASTMQEYEELRCEVRRMLMSKTDKALEKLSLIDDVQRLGVAYHFQREIEHELHNISHYSDGGGDLATVALRFRLLRQQGEQVSCGVFEQFKDREGKWKASLVDDVIGMLSLYEAAFLSINGEDIFDEVISFTTSHLQKSIALNNQLISPQLKERINHALNRPIRKSLPRLEARYYIDIYSNDNDYSSQNRKLLKFAKLDFNMLQAHHQRELGLVTKWWKNLDFATKLPYCRNRVVECYFWMMGVRFEPQYSLTRTIMTKVISMASVLDDTYDAYATFEELVPLTNAIQRWDITAKDTLPDYMKLIYGTLLDVYREAEVEMRREGKPCYINYAINAIKTLVQSYLVEAKWCKEGCVPKIDEFMQNSLISSGYPMLFAAFFAFMTEFASQPALEWVSNDPKIVKASSLIARFMDDIATHEFEEKREHVASSVQCYMKGLGISKEEVIELLGREVKNAWKDINEECLKPLAVPMPLLECIVNLTRVMDVIYKEGDGYTNSHILKDHISGLLLNPVVL